MNPFGDSDYYISVYRGWIQIPAAGSYGFCTASNEASFSFIDGQHLVDWPGRHTEQRGKHGEFNATVQLAAGPHYVEYLHEEVLLYQLAYLGYRPPGSDHFEAIPDAMFPLPRSASVSRYEQAPGQPAVALRAELLDSVWPQDKTVAQFTRMRLATDGGTAAHDWSGWKVAWELGDGLAADGLEVEHVYLRTGTYMVKMTAVDPAGNEAVVTRRIEVFPVEHLGSPFVAGQMADYVPIVSKYDAAQLDASQLGALVQFIADSGQQAAAERLAGEILARPQADDGVKAAAHLVLAADAGLAGKIWDAAVPKDRLPPVVEHLQAAERLSADRVAKLSAAARLVRVLGIEQRDIPAAKSVYDRALGDAKAPSTSQVAGNEQDASRSGLRDMHLALGDVYLAGREPGRAAAAYREAEQLAETPIPQVVRAARIGEYPDAIGQEIRDKRLDVAAEMVQEWRDQFPSDQVKGTALFWQGKLQLLRGKPAAALRPLQLAVNLGEGSDFEAEARWLLAEAYQAAGDTKRREATLKALVAAGLSGPFRDKAVAALKKP